MTDECSPSASNRALLDRALLDLMRRLIVRVPPPRLFRRCSVSDNHTSSWPALNTERRLTGIHAPRVLRTTWCGGTLLSDMARARARGFDFSLAFLADFFVGRPTTAAHALHKLALY